jgi:hypothetical protein
VVHGVEAHSGHIEVETAAVGAFNRHPQIPDLHRKGASRPPRPAAGPQA